MCRDSNKCTLAVLEARTSAQKPDRCKHVACCSVWKTIVTSSGGKNKMTEGMADVDAVVARGCRAREGRGMCRVLVCANLAQTDSQPRIDLAWSIASETKTHDALKAARRRSASTRDWSVRLGCLTALPESSVLAWIPASPTTPSSWPTAASLHDYHCLSSERTFHPAIWLPRRAHPASIEPACRSHTAETCRLGSLQSLGMLLTGSGGGRASNCMC